MKKPKDKFVTIIDNYDSFVYNISQYCEQLGAEVAVFRNDEIAKNEIPKRTTHLIISPGPCTPTQAGISNEMINYWAGKIPIIGVCLGHQCIGEVFGGKIIKSPKVMHGKISQIHHDGKGIYQGQIDNPLAVVRYHSLVISRNHFPSNLIISATLEEDYKKNKNGVIMGVRHLSLPIEGVQFHPEAHYSKLGIDLLDNFLYQEISL